jgi:transposase InsO family protein
LKREIIRREAIKLKLQNKTSKEIIDYLKQRFDYPITRMTLSRWMNRFNQTEWDFKDISQRPKTIHKKFTEQDKLLVVEQRKKQGYSSQKLRINLRNKNIFMSESTIKRIVKGYGLSNGNKMEGIRLKWVRFERDNPNSMWQMDGTELQDGRWLVIVEDDCSRYCVGAMIFDSLTTANMILLLEECIRMHGKPREILTDNGHEFGGVKGNDSQFDRWCEKQGILHIRTGIHKATTLGKIGAIQQTYFREIVYCNNDLEAWRKRYNCDRPHESLRMLTPLVVYFQYKRHKKHYDL